MGLGTLKLAKGGQWCCHRDADISRANLSCAGTRQPFSWAAFFMFLECSHTLSSHAVRLSPSKAPLARDLAAAHLDTVPDLHRAGIAPPAVVPKGTPLNGDATHFSVLSYNLLAPIFVRPLDLRTGRVQDFAAFQWAEPFDEVLAWEARQPRLLAELRASGADVICLQELQFEQTKDDVFVLPSWLRLEGYEAVLPDQAALRAIAGRNKRVLDVNTAVGNVILYQRDRLELCNKSAISSTNTRVAAALRGRPGTMLETLSRTVIFSVHLDATSEQKRVDQLSTCLDITRQAGTREVVIAGDMNSECLLGSCVGAFLDGTTPAASDLARECATALWLNGESPTEEQLKTWSELRQKAIDAPLSHRITLSHLETGPTRAAYDHGKNCGPCVSWCLDHIFYSTRNLQLQTSWNALEADEESAAAGLPNHKCPSDHLPIAATFKPLPAALDGAQAAALVKQVDAMDARQAVEQQLLRDKLAALEPPPATTAAEPTVETSIGEPAKKGKKTVKARASPEMIAFIQNKRRQERELKAAHLAERETLAKAWGDLELDVMEQHISIEQWVESGAQQ